MLHHATSSAFQPRLTATMPLRSAARIEPKLPEELLPFTVRLRLCKNPLKSGNCVDR